MAVFAQNTHVYAYGLLLYHPTVKVNVLGRFLKPGMRIIDEFQVQTYRFLQSRSLFWKNIDYNWIGRKKQLHNKSICEQTKIATNISRPLLESS